MIGSNAVPPVVVGWIFPGCHLGGAELHALTLMRFVDPRQVRWSGLAVVYPEHMGAMAESLAAHCPVTAGVAAAEALYDACDVVIRWGVPGDVAAPPPRPRRCRVVLCSHGVGPWTEPVFARWGDADALVAVSRAALRPMPAPARGRAVVIPNGVDPCRLRASPAAREALCRRLDAPADRPVVLYLGRVSDEKNPAAFVRGAAAAGPGGATWALAGDGLGMEDLAAEARATAPWVRLLGPVSDVGNLLAAADVLVMPSREEADSLALLEAFCAGVPVVSTLTGRLLEPPYHGFVRALPPEPDGAELAAAVAAELADPAAGRARAAAAREWCGARHDAGLMAARWAELLATLAGRPAGPGRRPCGCGGGLSGGRP